MIKEFFKKTREIALRSIASQLEHESFVKIKGEVFWKMTNSVTGKVEEGHMHNVVTQDASILVARMLKGPVSPLPNVSEPSFGIYALAVGSGDISWNLQSPPPPTNTQRSLFNELGRKTIATASFVTAEGTLSSIPTSRIDLTTVFGESEAVGPICEMGLLGGDINPNLAITNPVLPPNGAYDPTVSLVGVDTLVNYITFPVKNKSVNDTLSWTWRLSL